VVVDLRRDLRVRRCGRGICYRLFVPLYFAFFAMGEPLSPDTGGAETGALNV